MASPCREEACAQVGKNGTDSEGGRSKKGKEYTWDTGGKTESCLGTQLFTPSSSCPDPATFQLWVLLLNLSL